MTPTRLLLPAATPTRWRLCVAGRQRHVRQSVGATREPDTIRWCHVSPVPMGDQPVSDEQHTDSVTPQKAPGLAVSIPITPHGGILEHFERAVLFHNLSFAVGDAKHAFRLLLSAVYSCQAMVELMYEECSDKCVSVTRENLKAALKSLLPGFALIEKIRIHDFHRFGITPPVTKGVMQSFKGPMKLKASKGAAMVSLPIGEAPNVVETGNSKVVMQRPLLSVNGHFYDEDAGRYVSLPMLIRDFLLAMPIAVAEHEKNRVQGQCKSDDPRHSPIWRGIYDEPASEYRLIDSKGVAKMMQ
ncbi:hypothetical protein [Lacipirellula sp.]|uniref:hypothetical protein n=1 Tax=Lacipirellula sp. TaxID=2691419 RepID=UPI003D11D24C